MGITKNPLVGVAQKGTVSNTEEEAVFELPCLICGKEIVYKYMEYQHTDLLTNATYFEMVSGYGGWHDTQEHCGVICDSCITKAVGLKRLKLKGFKG